MLDIHGGIGVRAKKFLGGRRQFAQQAPKVRDFLGRSGSMHPWEILKSRVSLMPIPAFWGEILCMDGQGMKGKIGKDELISG